MPSDNRLIRPAASNPSRRTIGQFLNQPNILPTKIKCTVFDRVSETRRKITFKVDGIRYTYERKTGLLFGGTHPRPKCRIGRPTLSLSEQKLNLPKDAIGILRLACKEAKTRGAEHSLPASLHSKGAVVAQALRLAFPELAKQVDEAA